MRFLRRRLLHGVVLLLGVSLFSFALCELAPGSYFDEMRLSPQVSPQTVAGLRARYGMDRPLPERYARWLLSVAHGELGYSFAYGAPVGPLLRERGGRTLLLTTAATLVAWLVAVPAGVLLAWRRGGPVDRLASGLSSGLLATPELLLALGLLLVAVRTRAFPVGGMVSPGFADLDAWGKARDLLWHMTLPVSALVLGVLPGLVRQVRASVADALQAPFLRAARAHGIPQRRLLFRYALPSAAHPLCTLLGLSIASLLSMSLLTEVVMSWPGLGPLLLEAILSRDVYLVIGPVMAGALLLLAGNMLADVLLFALDPRIRREDAA